MNIQQQIDDMKRRATLSTLWIFVLLNVIFRDIHELFRPGLLEEMMTGTVNGVDMTESVLLAAGIALQIPLMMVVFSRMGRYRLVRWTSFIASPVTILSFLGNGINDMDDVLFFSIASIALVAIMVYAWTWPQPYLSSEGKAYATS